MEIGLIGLNHKPPRWNSGAAFLDLRPGRGGYGGSRPPSVVKEALTLATCNRVEILSPPKTWTRPSRRSSGPGRSPRRTEAGLKPHIYVYRGDEAVQHLFRVAASLDSLVVGEPQILGQLKTAYREAVNNRSTGVIMNRLLHKAFTVAKRIRTETGIADNAVSISFAAVELAKKIFQDLSGKKVLLVGAGEMAELAADIWSIIRSRKSWWPTGPWNGPWTWPIAGGAGRCPCRRPRGLKRGGHRDQLHRGPGHTYPAG